MHLRMPGRFQLWGGYWKYVRVVIRNGYVCRDELARGLLLNRGNRADALGPEKAVVGYTVQDALQCYRGIFLGLSLVQW